MALYKTLSDYSSQIFQYSLLLHEDSWGFLQEILFQICKLLSCSLATSHISFVIKSTTVHKARKSLPYSLYRYHHGLKVSAYCL